MDLQDETTRGETTPEVNTTEVNTDPDFIALNENNKILLDAITKEKIKLLKADSIYSYDSILNFTIKIIFLLCATHIIYILKTQAFYTATDKLSVLFVCIASVTLIMMNVNYSKFLTKYLEILFE
jgi:hypothetical protein